MVFIDARACQWWQAFQRFGMCRIALHRVVLRCVARDKKNAGESVGEVDKKVAEAGIFRLFWLLVKVFLCLNLLHYLDIKKNIFSRCEKRFGSVKN
jgi:hypothetical protein